MTKTVKNMLDEAFDKVPMVEPTEAIKWIDDPDTVFVDVRDKNSVINSGKIKGAIHAERGLLEFYADQEHDMGIDEISPEKKVILYCNAGGQAALAGKTLLEMGYKEVLNLGSFNNWEKFGGPTEWITQICNHFIIDYIFRQS